jgi:hypothetical protein
MTRKRLKDGRMTMLHHLKCRVLACFAGALAGLMGWAAFAGAAWAQAGEPIKIGYGISQTGGLAPNGKSALLAQKIWEADINAKGGCSAARSSSSTTMIRPTRPPCPVSTPSCSMSTKSI